MSHCPQAVPAGRLGGRPEDRRSPFWLRAEERPSEARTPLTPDLARRLMSRGHRVCVESAPHRCIPDQAFADAGCELVAPGSWTRAPENAVILGLKEIDPASGPFRNRHVHFAHVYKRQENWRSTLRQFVAGGGTLYDLEFLTDPDGRRLAAFGYWAGFLGAALGVIAWCRQQDDRSATLEAVRPWRDRDALLGQLRARLASTAFRPDVLVIGARGRSGRGAVDLCESLGLRHVGWQRKETEGPMPNDELLDHDVLVNCIGSTGPVDPFTTLTHLDRPGRRLSVISDVTCDLTANSNALPIYETCTSLAEPARRLLEPGIGRRGAPPLDLVAIDHLPTLLPRESSLDFARQLSNSLEDFDADTRGVWRRARQTFEQKCAEALGQPAIHWLGAGLSSTPGIVRLADSARSLTVWDRDARRARDAVVAAREAHPEGRVRAETLGWERLRPTVQAGDVVVSMLPGEHHARVARLCVERGAHFVCSSYVTDAVAGLHAEATAKGLCLVNEVGLDPGIDHLYAHALLDRYRDSAAYSPDHRLSFRSYCGGLPQALDAFCYKFSWSPVGVLKALRAQARWIDGSRVRECDRPWEAIREIAVPVASGGMETFEAYPNRDSLPFRQQYRLDPSWNIDEFVRGTLRPHGWAAAWRNIFVELEALADSLPDVVDARLQALSDDLWSKHAYASDETDRVVLSVELEVRTSEGQPVWHKRHWLDEHGDGTSSAMARLVSWTVSLAVEDVIHGRSPVGVRTTPTEGANVTHWIDRLETLGVRSYLSHGSNSLDRCIALRQGVRTLFAPREARAGASSAIG